MAENSPNYKALFLEAEKQRAEAEEQRKQAEDEERREKERREPAEERWKQADENNRLTTFVELLRHSHNLFSRPMRVEIPSLATPGTIPLPTGKYCPTRLEPWTDCSAQQLELYKSVYGYFQSTPKGAPHLFTCFSHLEAFGQQLCMGPIGSERDLGMYERLAVEKHIADIISELCKIPAARDEFGLGGGIQFHNYHHTNVLHENETNASDTSQLSSVHRPRPDQSCIHRVEDITTVLTSVEYLLPHKLSVATLRMGLRPMDIWKEMVCSNKTPTDQKAKLRYDAERLVCSALVHEYHLMIQEGLEYSYVTNGLAQVLLRVPHDDPKTLYYFLCDHLTDVTADSDESFQQPMTSVARALCLCLMAFRSVARNQEWRNSARAEIPIWDNSSRISLANVQNALDRSDSTVLEDASLDTDSAAHEPRSSPPDHSKPADFRLSTVSPATAQDLDAKFCTQRCLLGLQYKGVLDDCCPNVISHRRGNRNLHPITSEDLVGSLRAQLDKNIDRCTPLGASGGYGAPFKLNCALYGYTVIGKGTTSGLWKEVSREAEVYRILRKAQGSAVPVFLGAIDLAKVYFLHAAGEIRHMLVMGWGGESTMSMELTPNLLKEIRKSNKEIKALGIIQDDLERENVLWNEELGRALIIDFRLSILESRPTLQRPRVKRRSQPEIRDPKRLRVTRRDKN
ncbi:unnamed protein product [Penicillium salamii]|uniref:Uncharacterized protein n=1 Tax=Penicillium salamii TaxID=1612424 RepID=A0A9W4JSP5_9EURO|nr:unnamed protein product [Penicillium salamii]